MNSHFDGPLSFVVGPASPDGRHYSFHMRLSGLTSCTRARHPRAGHGAGGPPNRAADWRNGRPAKRLNRSSPSRRRAVSWAGHRNNFFTKQQKSCYPSFDQPILCSGAGKGKPMESMAVFGQPNRRVEGEGRNFLFELAVTH